MAYQADLHLTGDADADAALSRDPLALLVGMLLDQQVTMEKAFSSPAVLAQRMKTKALDAKKIAGMAPEKLTEIFSTPPALHRFPGSMAARTQQLCAALVNDYGGKAEAVWSGVKDGDELLARLRALPGFGEQKAKIFLALLGKQVGIRPKGWRESAGAYGEDDVFRSVADIVDSASLAKVRAYKQQMKAAAKAAAAT
jgi:uncharacterized HhH-GPD family protein